MFEKSRLFREVSPFNLLAYREAKVIAALDKLLLKTEIQQEVSVLENALARMDGACTQEPRAAMPIDEGGANDNASDARGKSP
jgi:hypothetical protein